MYNVCILCRPRYFAPLLLDRISGMAVASESHIPYLSSRESGTTVSLIIKQIFDHLQHASSYYDLW